MLTTLRFFRDQHGIELQATDWLSLVRLPHPRLAKDVQDLFFPKLEEEREADVSRLRVRGFLEDLHDTRYDEVYHLIISHPEITFPNVHKLLKTNQRDGRIMRTIMAHVGQWLNQEPFRVTDRASDKPLLRKDFLPALRQRFPDTADAESIELQQRILHFVQTRMGDWTQTTVGRFLEVYPIDAVDTYRERFDYPVWKDLLYLVYEFCGPHFQADAMILFNQEPPSRSNAWPIFTIAHSMCQVLHQLPEVTHNPALHGTAATQALRDRLQTPILQWAIEQCESFLDGKDDVSSEPRLPIIREQLARYRAQLEGKQDSTVETIKRSKVAETPRAEKRRWSAAPSSQVSVLSDRITPRLVKTQAPAKAPSAQEILEQRPYDLPPVKTAAPAKRHPNAGYDLDAILGLSQKPRKLKSNQHGRGWRSRPGAHSRSDGGILK